MSAESGKRVQEVVDRMARNDPTMKKADLSSECAAADGAAAVALLQMQEGRVRGVDCVCATEPPCSSGTELGDVGAASLAQALEKNTTLYRLQLQCEFVVLCLFWWRGVCVVLIVCAPLNRRALQSTNWATRALHRWRKLLRRTRPCIRWNFTVSLLLCIDLCFGRAFDCGLWCCGLFFVCVWGGGTCALC
jgi:hypothetical protein